MDEKEIAFIICRKDTAWFEECVRYIQDLNIGEYTVDIISIDDTASIPVAYNAAMESSRAKYKIYLHEDTFILHKDLIPDLLKIFNEDPLIGMIGMIGCQKLSADIGGGQHWDMGRAYLDDGFHVNDQDLRSGQEEKGGYAFAEAIDGFFIATQYDLKWQEELAEEGTYAISHSSGMRDLGKKIAVPWQKEPWCYHGQKDRAGEDGDLRRRLVQIAEEGAYDTIWPVIDGVRTLKDREICAIAGLAEICVLEKASRQGLSSGWWWSHAWDEIYGIYDQVRFILMRMAYHREDERVQQLEMMAEQGKIHRDALLSLAGAVWPGGEEVCQLLPRVQREEPLVSVVLPVYNGADHVGVTIESILGQTYQNMEVIIIDDASTDSSLEVIRSYQDPRIRVITCEKNRNVVYSSNIGFKAAKGKYVALIGHDDLWEQDKLEKQITFLEEHPSYSVCFTRMDVIDEELRICKDSAFYRIFYETNREAKNWIRELFFKGNHLCAPSACIRKEMLDKAGYYRYALLQLQDYDLWLRLFLEGEVYIYPERLTYYRRFRNKKSLSAVTDESIIRHQHEMQYVWSRYIKDMPWETFRTIFIYDMLDANACGEKAILCEKALFLWKNKVYSGLYEIAELLEDEECRKILEESYQVDTGYFYRANAQPIHFE